MTFGKKVLVLAAIVALVALAPAANAATFNFTDDHCTGGCGSSPFGNVVLTQNGANVGFVVTLFNSNQFVKSGAGDFMNFKFNATGVALGDIVVDAHVPVLAAATGSFTGNGTGSFAFGITCPTCGNGGSGQYAPAITFTVLNSTIADFTTPNAGGFIFAADIISGQTGNTGPVGAKGSTSTVPEPITSGLVGTGLIGLFFLGRRRAARKV